MNFFKCHKFLHSIFLAGVAGILLLSHSLQGQSSLGRSALNKMEKGNWMKAEQYLRKSLTKDTLNAEAHYVYSLIYFSETYPKRNLDSAYHYVLASLSDFQKSSFKQREKLERFPLDSAILVNLRNKVDSAAFERAKTINTEKSYQFFLEQFTFASQHDAAIELRDEIAFIGALKINTYKVFRDYIDQYPASHRKEEAKMRYEKLLFEDKTRDGKLKSYEKFLNEYPSTIYRSEIEKNIFEISTAIGTPDAFQQFIKSYPESNFKKKAINILYHLQHGDEGALDDLRLFDSLKQVNSLEKGYWVPVLKNEKFGFMDQYGAETMAPRFDIIYDDYKCGEIRTDFVITSEGIISRGGVNIYKGLTEEVFELGLGFLKVQDSSCLQIVHKSGFKLNSFCLEDTKIVANQFIGYKKNGKWGLLALNGRNLLPPEYEDIYSLEEIVVLVRSGKRLIKTPEQIGSVADKNPFSESMVFDEVRQIEVGTYLVKNAALEGTLNSNLEFIIPLDRQILSKTPYGYVTKKDEKYKVIGIDKELSGQQFDEIRFYENWLSLKNENEFQLFNIPAKKSVGMKLDSIWFLNHLAFALKDDTLNVFLKSGLSKKFLAQSDFQFINSPDSELFFYAQERNKKSVFDGVTGNRLFQLSFDEIEYFGNKIFMITRDGKKGLVSNEGKPILPNEYSLIVLTQKNYASLFREKKFGLFDLKNGKLLKPLFERNVKPLQANVFIASKEGYLGFIDVEAKPYGKFEFEEILEWNDSSALVKKNFHWMIFNWYTNKVSINRIKDYRIVLTSDFERILIIHQDTGYGIISNRLGGVIPSTFSDIVNIGSDEEPLYFTEKSVEEADIYVVIYYNKQGKLLRRQVFEKEEYDEIYCEDK